MSDLRRFFLEQQQRMNIPDEDFEDYVERRQWQKPTGELISPLSMVNSTSDAHTWQNSPVTRQDICRDSTVQKDRGNAREYGEASRNSPNRSTDPSASPCMTSANSTSIKRKASDSEPDDCARVNKKSKADTQTIDLNEHTGISPGPMPIDQLNRKGHALDQSATNRFSASDEPSVKGPRSTSKKQQVSKISEPSVTPVSVSRDKQKAPKGRPVAVWEPAHNADAQSAHALEDKIPPQGSSPTTQSGTVGQISNAARKKILKADKEDAVVETSNITTPASSVALPLASTSKVKVPAQSGKGSTVKATASRAPAKKKSKPELVMPPVFAQSLLDSVADGSFKLFRNPYMKGKHVYFYGGDMTYAREGTRNKMKLLVRHGATLYPFYDPEKITHIISEGSQRGLLQSMGVKSLKDIPEDIPILRWSWVNSGRDPSDMGRYHDYAAYAGRITLDTVYDRDVVAARRQRTKSTTMVQAQVPLEGSDDTGETSRISEFTQDRVVHGPSYHGPDKHVDFPSHTTSSMSSDSGGTGPKPSNGKGVSSDVKLLPSSAHMEAFSKARSSVNEDPLAAFYDQALAEQKAEQSAKQDIDDTDDEDDQNERWVPRGDRTSVKNGVFLCDKKRAATPGIACPNQDVIDKLEELKAVHATKLSEEDKWRVYTYNKAISSLRNHPTRIKSYEEARSLRNVGDKTAKKIMEIIQTGNLRRIKYEKTEDVEITNLFIGIYGVGRNIAHQWYNNGCRTLEDLRNGKGGVKLSAAQEIGLKYYDDINDRMPRSEAQDIFNLIKPIALSIDSNLFIEIMGSFRRGKADCGDVDLLITRPTADGKTHVGVLKRLLAKLRRCGIITEDLCEPDDWDDLELVYRGLCRRDSDSRHRRIDFLTVPYESRGAALLYYTGDDIFNRSMRLKANKMGYSLNQRGLYKDVIRNPSDRKQKLSNGTIIASETEREIFEKLNVDWKEPHERVCH